MAEIEHNNASISKSQNNLLIRCFVSLISVLLTHFSLFLVPHLFPTSSSSSSLMILLPLSGVLVLVVGGLGRICKNLVGLRASAPAFVVLSILYVWCVYFALIRQAISSILDIVFNAEIGLLLIGLCSIVSSDPGYVAYGSSYPGKPASSPLLHVESHFEDLEPSSSDARDTLLAVEESTLVQRVRFCKVCKLHVKGFDHHCPAFGNCIGQKNHVLFIILLVGLIISEASYIGCSSKFIMKSHVLANWSKNTLSINLAYSTMLFSLLQVLWQVIFLIWHIYCVCFNITTDEWVNWKKYPEFQLVVEHQQGTRFKNPYDKGVLQNLKNFLKAEG